MFFLCMLVCSAEDALVVAAELHFAALCLPEVEKILHLYHVLTDDACADAL